MALLSVVWFALGRGMLREGPTEVVDRYLDAVRAGDCAALGDVGQSNDEGLCRHGLFTTVGRAFADARSMPGTERVDGSAASVRVATTTPSGPGVMVFHLGDDGGRWRVESFELDPSSVAPHGAVGPQG